MKQVIGKFSHYSTWITFGTHSANFQYISPCSFVNHTLANLDKDDFNPVALKHASPIEQGQKPGFTREEGIEWAKEVEREMREPQPVALQGKTLKKKTEGQI
jgi:hypothetical protein